MRLSLLAFAREAGLYEVQITFLTAFPGTPLYARLKQEGRSPVIVVATTPTELIVIEGGPNFVAIPGTGLKEIKEHGRTRSRSINAGISCHRTLPVRPSRSMMRPAWPASSSGTT
jgi:hypothetical protein